MVCFLFLGFDCRKRWFQLRDCFRKAYQKRINTPAGQTAKKTRPWRYESVMEFIIPHMVERKQFSSNDVESDESIDSFSQQHTFDGAEGETEESQDVQTQFAEGRITPQHATEENSSLPGSSQCNKIPSVGPSPSIVKYSSRSLNREKDKYKQPQAVSSVLQGYLYPTKNEEAATEDDDVLSTFFKAMEKTVRTFSIPLQIETKRKISNLINDCELKNYMDQSAGTSNSRAFANQMRQLSANSAKSISFMPSIPDSSLSNMCSSSMTFPTHMKLSPSSVNSCNSSDANRIDALLPHKRPNSDEDESGFGKQPRHDS